MAHTLPYFSSVRITALDCLTVFPIRLLFRLPGAPYPGCALPLCPHSSDIQQYRNLNLLSIGYAFQPGLRPRLTQSRSALLWKPWIFGLEDSHFYLATHSGILSSKHSTAPCRYSFNAFAMLLYQSQYILCTAIPKLRCSVSAPDIFGAGPLD